MYLNAKASELLPVVGKISPQTVSNSATVYSDVVDVSKYHGVYAIALTGDMANETIDFKCYTCDSDGSNPTALSGYAMTQLAASASANDNKGATISLQSDALIASGKQYIKFGMVTGNSTGGSCSMVVLGVGPRLGPVSSIAAIVQTV